MNRSLKRTLTLVLILAHLPVLAQVTLIKRVEVKGDYLTADNLGNVYVIKSDALIKYDQDGNELLRYSNKVLGEVQHMDATNPLKLLLFYRDLTQVVFLDNRLSLRASPTALEDIGFNRALLTCTSHSSGMWLYDGFEFELVRLDQNLKEVRRTGNLNQALGLQLDPNFLVEANNWVYMNDPVRGILIFDIYGTYYKTIPIKGLSRFQLFDNQLYYQRENHIFRYHLRTLEETRLDLPENETFRSFGVAERRLYLLDQDGVKFYRRESL